MLLLRLACRGLLSTHAFVVRTRIMPALPGRLWTSHTGMAESSSGSRRNAASTEKTPKEKEIIQAERDARK
jgi:hypothetical protein